MMDEGFVEFRGVLTFIVLLGSRAGRCCVFANKSGRIRMMPTAQAIVVRFSRNLSMMFSFAGYPWECIIGSAPGRFIVLVGLFFLL